MWSLHLTVCQRQPALHPLADSAIVSSFTCPGRWTVSYHRAQHTDVTQPCHPALFVVQDKVLAFIPNWTCCSKPGLRQLWHAQLSVTSFESLQAVPAAFHSTAVSCLNHYEQRMLYPSERRQLEIHHFLQSVSLLTEISSLSQMGLKKNHSIKTLISLSNILWWES